MECGVGMEHKEIKSIGKYWLWMTVFSMCLFTSCGEANRNPQPPASSIPKPQAIPVQHDREDYQTEEIEEEQYWDSDPWKELPDPEFDERNLEQFEDEEFRPDIVEEVRKSETENEDGEMEAKSELPTEAHSETNTEVALHESSDLPKVNTQPDPPPSSSSASTQAAPLSKIEAAWKAQFEALGDPNDFEPDSPDEFEYLD